MFAETEVNEMRITLPRKFFSWNRGVTKWFESFQRVSLAGAQSNVSGNGSERDENKFAHQFFSWNRSILYTFTSFFLISRGAQCGLSIVSPSSRRKVPTAAARMSVCMCSGLSTGHEKHDGRFAQKACVTSDDIFMWCHKLSLPIQKRSIFYHLGIQSCLSAFGGSLNSTPADWIVAPAAAACGGGGGCCRRHRWADQEACSNHLLLFT